MSVYQNAKEFWDRGIAICPIPYRRKIPSQPWEQYQTIFPSEKNLREWFPCEQRNYGIVLGWQRLAVLDFDDMTAFYDWNLWTIENCSLLDNALCVKTSRGIHVYFTLLEDLNNMKLPNIDFKIHGFCIGPGSTHPNGHIYRKMSQFNFPIVEKLEQILPAEIIAQARNAMENFVPVAPLIPAIQPSLSLLDEINQADNIAKMTPLEKIAARWRLEAFFPGEKADHSGYLHVCCPFSHNGHKDTHPSAWVDTKRQLFGCHSCNMKPMTVLGFYAALHQLDIKSAIKEMLA